MSSELRLHKSAGSGNEPLIFDAKLVRLRFWKLIGLLLLPPPHAEVEAESCAEAGADAKRNSPDQQRK